MDLGSPSDQNGATAHRVLIAFSYSTVLTEGFFLQWGLHANQRQIHRSFPIPLLGGNPKREMILKSQMLRLSGGSENGIAG